MLKSLLSSEKADRAAQVGLVVVVFTTGFACAVLQHALEKKEQFEKRTKEGTG
jgi:hypothetical protein